MKQKRSQITLFIIIAIVLFTIIGLFFYLTKYTAKKQTGYETTKTQKIKMEVQPIENYVTQCLDKTTKDGLILLGKQGGYLYKGQGGPLIDYREDDEGLFFVNYNNHRVSYGIYPLRFDMWPYYAKAPDWPWVTFPYTDETKTQNTSEGLFGISNLPPINSSFGANSIKSQLEIYIENNIKECIKWSVFEEQGYEISENTLNVDLGITKEDLVVHLVYPLTIKNKITGGSTTIQDFFVREKVRLGKIYDFVFDLVNKDITDIEFNIGIVREDSLYVDIVRNVLGKDDIVIVRDEKSLINKEPYEFIFARHNRMPALHYITPLSVTRPSAVPFYIIKDEDLIPGGILSLKAIDPDEDLTTFSIVSSSPSGRTPPTELDLPKIEFHVRVSDGGLEDYQVITVLREEE